MRTRIARASAIAYALAVLAVWLLLHFGGDRWWFPTVMLFGPRWVYALPLLVLGPYVLWANWRMAWLLLASTVILVGPILGFCVPRAGWTASDGPALRVLTCNVGEHRVDRAKLIALIHEVMPDVVLLQECPPDTQWELPAGWEVRRADELLVASAYPIARHEVSPCRYSADAESPTNALYCVLEGPMGTIGVCNVHLRSPRGGLAIALDRATVVSPARAGSLANEIALRRQESEDVARWLCTFPEPRIVAGDFNMPTDSAIYRQSWAGYDNTFSSAGFGFGHTKHTVIHGWQYGSRIDHILGGPGWRAQCCWVGHDVGSDHLPLIADLRWVGTSE